MKSDKKIFIAFLLNLSFSVLECVGGIVTGSVAILSDAVHDLGDAISICLAFLLERKSKKKPDETHTYGYGRYSVLGGIVTALILLLGSILVIYNAILRIIHPSPVHYNGMMALAVVGVVVNLVAAFITGDGHSLNQRAVSLHMFEDVLGWIVVLVGAIVMRVTDVALIDPIMSIGVSLFILIHAMKHLKEALDLFLKKVPRGINVLDIKEDILVMEDVMDVHHIHVWSMDGLHHYATMHIVTNADAHAVKEKVRDTLRVHGIVHATLELEAEDEPCHEPHCHVEAAPRGGHHHHCRAETRKAHRTVCLSCWVRKNAGITRIPAFLNLVAGGRFELPTFGL